MAKEQEIITKIFLNDEQAKSKLEELGRKMDSIRERRDKAFSVGDMPQVKKLNEDLRNTQREMNKVSASGEQIKRTLENLSTASVKELRRTMAQINGELRSGSVKRGSEEWKVLNTQLKRCKEELQRISMESKAAVQGKSFFSKAADFLNTNWGAITQSIAGFATFSQMVRSTIQSFADMDQEMQNVRKYTGQTTGEVEHMNEAFKRMDTRTSREELNQLAGAAGRLGITSEKSIMEFVDAADKINVALGDDLGKGAVDSIGKLAMAFGEDDRMGLRGAMLATGSAVNELAQNSSTNAGYLVDFTARLAGVGVQAGISQAQIMGWGSVLDENMQKEEMAATSLSKIIATMATDSSKMAKVAGLDAKKFADLVKTDMNGALMEFFDAMNKKGGFTALAPMFADMGLDGARATSVLAVLASKIDDVRKNQTTANEAYAKGTSVIEEFNTQNLTVQAGLDKALKQFKDLSVELGERLEPVGKYTISTMSLGIKVLNELIKFTGEHWRLLISLGATIAVITAVYKAKAVAEMASAAVTKVHNAAIAVGNALYKAHLAIVGTVKVAYALLTGNITKAKAAMEAMSRVMKANPFGILLTVLAAVIGAVIAVVASMRKNNAELQRMREEMDAGRQAAKSWADIQKEAGRQTAEEKAKVQALTSVIHSNSYSIGERKKAIAALRQIIPDYHAEISREGKLYNDNSAAIDQYIRKMEAMATAQAYLSKIAKLKEEQADLEIEKMKAEHDRRSMADYLRRHKIPKTETRMVGGGISGSIQTVETPTKGYQALEKQDRKVDDINKKLAVNIGQQKQLMAIMKEQENRNPLITAALTDGAGGTQQTAGGGSSSSTASSSSSSYVSEAQQKKEEQERKKREAALKKAAAEEKSRYNLEMRQAKARQQANVDSLKAVYATGGMVFAEYERKMVDAQADGLQRRMDIMQRYGFQETDEYERLEAEKQRILEEGNRKIEEIKNKASIRQLELEQRTREEELRIRFNTPADEIYQDEMALNEALFQSDLAFLRKRQALYSSSSEEYMSIADQMEDLEKNHQLDLQQQAFDRLLELRKQYQEENIDLIEQAAEKELAAIYDRLKAEGAMTEEEYSGMLSKMKKFYAQRRREQARDDADKKLSDAIAGTSSAKMRENSENAFKTAKAGAVTKLDGKQQSPLSNYFAGDIQMYQATSERLREMYKSNEISHAEMCQAMAMAEQELCEGISEKMQMVMSAVGSIMSGMSSYYSAASEYEVNVVTKKYDKEIEAAGNNSKKVKKLEEKKQKEIAAIKTKYARRQAAIQVAQALAQTAQAAINAYSSAAAIPVVGHILAPIAAAAATAAGMLQVAAIQKQQKAQEAGYYEGGFTGGSSYRRRAGVVHEGEFVANHQAVNNPAILPVLNFIDQAQRNNTVGSLTAQDVSRNMGMAAPQPPVVAPVVNVQTDNTELRQTISDMSSAMERLNGILDQGIDAPVYIEDVDRQLKRYNKMRTRK